MNNWILRLEGITIALLVYGEIGGAIFAGAAAASLHIIRKYK